MYVVQAHYLWYQKHTHSSLSLPAPEALTLNKELEFAAIQAVLRHLDDNHDGSVDLQESEEVGCHHHLLLLTCLTHRERERERVWSLSAGFIFNVHMYLAVYLCLMSQYQMECDRLALKLVHQT